MNAIPLIQTVDKDSINTSLIALKKASEELKALNDEVTKKLALVNSAIADLNLDTVGGDGKLIQSISQSKGQVSASAIDIATSVESGNTQPVTSGAVADYTVDRIEVNNSQPVTSNAVYKAFNNMWIQRGSDNLKKCVMNIDVMADGIYSIHFYWDENNYYFLRMNGTTRQIQFGFVQDGIEYIYKTL